MGYYRFKMNDIGLVAIFLFSVGLKGKQSRFF
jgi:hypothetical protein